MTKRRLLVFCLDAFDAALGDQLIAEGKLKGLAKLKEDSARFKLEHGDGNRARYTGLTWEHFSTGQKPDTIGKWSVINFHPENYEAEQIYANERPFFADLKAKTVVFDAPYFHLAGMENGVGVVGWSGHDTGAMRYSQPTNLITEIYDKFGQPPSHLELNDMVYSSVENTRKMGQIILKALKQRAEAAEWLFAEREPDWDIALLGIGETHDIIELMFHGLDPEHHLADHPSAPVAREALIAVYEEMSNIIERMRAKFPDAISVAFTMHGMGKNDTDLPTMLLLPELMYKLQFGRNLFHSPERWAKSKSPSLAPGESWNQAVNACMEHPLKTRVKMAYWNAKGGLMSRGKAQEVADIEVDESAPLDPAEIPDSFGVNWMPADQYKLYWKSMDAFALPAYFDGRVRINLEGRERDGRVPLNKYHETVRKIEKILRECRDIKTGQPVVKELSMPGLDDPLNLPGTQADIKIIWDGSPIGFKHPDIGVVGPGPIRRSGGHSGGYGELLIAGDGIETGDFGVKSSFDVAPTLVDLLGLIRPNRMDGESVFKNSRALESSDA